MKNFCYLIIISMVFFNFSTLSAQDESWEELKEKVFEYYEKGDLDSAIIYGEKAKIQAKKQFGENHTTFASSLYNLGLLYKGVGKYKMAEQLYIQAIEIEKEQYGEKNTDYAESLSNLATLYCDMGKYKKAEKLYMQVLAIEKELLGEKHLSYARSLSNLTTLYNDMARYKEAEPLLVQAMNIIKEQLGENHLDYATIVGNLAFLYKKLGWYNKAEPLYIKAMKIRKERLGENHFNYAISLINLTSLYFEMGRYEKAETLFIKVLNIWKKTLGEEHPYYAKSLNNLAGLYKIMKRYEKAEPLLIQATNIRKVQLGENHPDYAESLNNLASLYKDMGNFKQAEPLFLKSMNIRKEQLGENHPDYAASLFHLAGLYDAIGNYEQAELLYIKSMNIRREQLGENHFSFAASLNNLASLYFDIGNYEKSEALLIQAIETEKRIFTNQSLFLSEKEKGNFWKKVSFNFELFNSFVMKRIGENPGIVKNQYNNLLFSKGVLLNSTIKMKKEIQNSGNFELKEKFNNWIYLKERISHFYSLPQTELENKGINLDSLQDKANNMEKQLSLLSDDFSKATDKKLYTWKDVQNALSENEAAVEMVRFKYLDKTWTDTIYYAALILTGNSSDDLETSDESGISLVLFKNGNDLESKYITHYKSNIMSKTEDVESYNQFWKPIADKLQELGIKKVYLSPEGVYNQLNLSTLYNPDTGKYLIDEMDIQIVGSTRDIVEKKEYQPLANTATLIGDPMFNLDSIQYNQQLAALAGSEDIAYIDKSYFSSEHERSMLDSLQRAGISRLPGTKREVQKISKLFSDNDWQATVYTGNSALEEVVKAQDNPRVLHIATHGKFLKDAERKEMEFGIEKEHFVENPLLKSMLILAGAENSLNQASYNNTNTDDGLLTAYEAMNLRLDKTELVVLSACETGLGDIKNGEGVYGLQRAFQVAGARTIIMSLWTVDDNTTQQLMTRFYEKWLSGMTKRQAFIEAQLELKKKYRHPYYWGAFVMVGE